MASPKNSKRSKRKYANISATIEKNRKHRKVRAEARVAKLKARTDSLVGHHVAVRIRDRLKPVIGTVLEVIRKDHDDYPTEARRHTGSYLRVRTPHADMLVSRHRVKVKE